MTEIQHSKPVSVIWYWNLRFACNLVLGVWDFIYPKPTLRSRYAQKWVQILATTCLVLTLYVPAAASDSDPAVKAVERLHAELLDVMKQARTLGFKGRYLRLEPVVTSSYDLPFISKVVVGRYWDRLTPEQQQKFVNTFTRLSIATYANQFAGYSGERFKTISAEEYILHQKERQWQIINVIAQGVSDLSLKRAQYTSYLKENGFDGLLQKIKEKIQAYEG
jgi:phospholipid transport system substrate-binding protein